MPADGTCTWWPDGPDGLWLDCCYPQHDCDCEAAEPLPCPQMANWRLLQCVKASSYSPKCKHPKLTRVNARLMFVGVNVLQPVLNRLSRIIKGEHVLLEDLE